MTNKKMFGGFTPEEAAYLVSGKEKVGKVATPGEAEDRSFSPEEISYLMTLDAVDTIYKNKRLGYSDSFIGCFQKLYEEGYSPCAIFRAAGLGSEIIGNKRIERSTYRWTKGHVAIRALNVDMCIQLKSCLDSSSLPNKFLGAVDADIKTVIAACDSAEGILLQTANATDDKAEYASCMTDALFLGRIRSSLEKALALKEKSEVVPE